MGLTRRLETSWPCGLGKHCRDRNSRSAGRRQHVWIDAEALGDVVFGVGFLGSYVAGVGAVFGFIGLALGRSLAGRVSN